MAGSPKKRARREALAAALAAIPELPELAKPLEEMTPAERLERAGQMRERMQAALKAFNQARRQADLRAGRARPRNMSEIELFAADLIVKRVDQEPTD